MSVNDAVTGKHNDAHGVVSDAEVASPSSTDEVEMATVSVVIATHNRPQLLRVALASVLEQTYAGPIEVVLVFDKTEPDLTLASSTDRRMVRVITNTRQPGLAGARNSGVLAATGKYVAFCDDDDSWFPGKLAAQIERLERSDALTSVTGIVIEYGDRSVPRVPRQDTFTLDHVARTRAMEGHPSSVVVRRDAFLGPIGMVDEELPGSYGEDFDWMLRALAAGPVAVVEEPLVHVLWGQSLFSQRWQTIIESIDYSMVKHEVLRTDRKAAARLYGRRAFANAALGERRAALRDAWATVRRSPREQRAYLATAVALRLVSSQRLMHIAHKRGQGI